MPNLHMVVVGYFFREEQMESIMARLKASFVKHKGEDTKYYIEHYLIILSWGSKRLIVNIDLCKLGGGLNISCQPMRSCYDIDKKRFTLKVLRKTGVTLKGCNILPKTFRLGLMHRICCRSRTRISFFPTSG